MGVYCEGLDLPYLGESMGP